jgi:hypothetical protein
MKNWQITLMRDGTAQKQWRVRGETVSIGSAPGCQVRLPFPAPALIATVDGSQGQTTLVDWESSWLQVNDVTSEVRSLEVLARVRLETSLEESAARWGSRPTLSLGVLALCMFLFAALLVPLLSADFRPQLLKSIQESRENLRAKKAARWAPQGTVLQAVRPAGSLPIATAQGSSSDVVMAFGVQLTSATDRGTNHVPASVGHGSFAKEMILGGLDPLPPAPSAWVTGERTLLYSSPDLLGLLHPG